MLDTVLTCERCSLAWYKGGVCVEHCRHFQTKKGWCYAMGLQSLRERLSGEGRTSTATNAPEDAAFQKKFPALWSFLVQTQWEDGTSRETGTVLIFVEDGVLKACASNRDSGHVAFVASQTVADLWGKLEKGIDGDSLDWRLSRAAKGSKGKRS